MPYMSESKEETHYVLQDIARKIRSLRQKQGLTVNALALKTGFAKSYLSQIENMKREPTIGTLVTIARALGVNVFHLMGGEGMTENEDAPVIVKPGDRRPVEIPSRSANLTYESINYMKNDRLMDGYILTADFEFSGEPMAHEGQELLFILEGKQEFMYNGKNYILEKGDCCCFDSNKPHGARSIGKKKSKALVVFVAKP